MRSAAARAARRRGSRTRMRPGTRPAPSMASGTRVVLPAPGGAASTAMRRAARAARSSSMGSPVMIRGLGATTAPVHRPGAGASQGKTPAPLDIPSRPSQEDRMSETDALADRLLSGDRRALARAITLVESARADHRAMAEALLDRLATEGREALRVGLSGTPGVGKSTFIEAFGMDLTGAGKRVAVLAVDPSSARTGGSILGDKTRMERLAREPLAYIRPSPSQTELGGVARRTREAIALCEAAGFDMVIVETVGVGQSETLVAEMTDIFVLLLAPGGGDELQGVKRGIMEIADLILINKADGDLEAAARRTAADYAGALRLMRPRPGDPQGWPRVETVSALTGAGLAEARQAMEALAAHRQESGAWAARRRGQARRWFEEEFRREVVRLATGAPGGAEVAALADAVAEGRRSPASAAREAAARLGLPHQSPAGL